MTSPDALQRLIDEELGKVWPGGKFEDHLAPIIYRIAEKCHALGVSAGKAEADKDISETCRNCGCQELAYEPEATIRSQPLREKEKG